MTKIQLKRSSALQSSTVSRAPTSSQLDYGELAINYNSADPQLFIKDSGGSVLRLLDYYAKVSGTTFTGDVNFDGELTIQGDSTNGSGQLTLTCEQNTHAVKIKAPAHSAAANYTLTLPSSAGTSSQVLTTDGSGNLSWALSSMSTADKNKLDGIESGSTADQTGAEIKSLYEAESNTNAFTDAEKVKLSGVAVGAEVNVGTNLSYTATSRLLSSSTGNDVNLPEATTSQPGLLSAADKTKLNGIETGATADQTASEILTAIKTVDGAGSGLDADLLDGIHASTFVRTDARAISLNNGATGSTGNEITVGNSTPQYTLRDTNLRPIVQVTGQYPTLSLNHTVTSNSNHGPTVQFTHNGYDSNEQIVVGSTGQGRWLDVGFSGGGYGTNTNYNPHNGISGYQGVTPVRIFSNGVLVGATGAYPNHVQSTSHALEVRGTAYLQGSNDRPLRVLKSSGYNSCAALIENQYGNNSWGIVGEFRVGSGIGNDRPSILFSSGYNSDTWSVGFGYSDSNFRIRTDHGWRNQQWGSERMTMDRSGNVTFSGNVTAYSDIRLKDKVAPLKNCLAKLKTLSGVSFIWKDKSEFIGNVGKIDFGIIAQEVEKVFPEVVHASSNTSDDGNNYKTVAYAKLIPVLIEAIKELDREHQKTIKEYSVRLSRLEGHTIT